MSSVYLVDDNRYVRNSGACEALNGVYPEISPDVEKIEGVYNRIVYSLDNSQTNLDLMVQLGLVARDVEILETQTENRVVEQLYRDVCNLKELLSHDTPHSTASEFSRLNHWNEYYRANIRGKVYGEYNSLMQQAGEVRGFIPECDDFEIFSQDRQTWIVRRDLFYYAIWKYVPLSYVAYRELDEANLAFKTDIRSAVYALLDGGSCDNFPIDIGDKTLLNRESFEKHRRELVPRTGDYFDAHDELNVEYSANVRKEIHERYNELLDEHHNGRGKIPEQGVGMDRTTWIIRKDLYEQAIDEAVIPHKVVKAIKEKTIRARPFYVLHFSDFERYHRGSGSPRVFACHFNKKMYRVFHGTHEGTTGFYIAKDPFFFPELNRSVHANAWK